MVPSAEKRRQTKERTMKATAPTTTETIRPIEIAANGWEPVLTAAGVGSNHVLYVSESGDRALYIETIEGGPNDTVTAWLGREQELPAWSFGRVWADPQARLEAEEEAANWVLLTARNALRSEMDLPTYAVEGV